jgi:hypothetical protein
MNMTPQQLQGAIRTLLAYLAGLAAGKSEALRGIADPVLIEAATTLVVALVGLWSFKSKAPAVPPSEPPKP